MNSKITPGSFDAIVFIRSVRYLVKGHTGEFEASCGVCRGYLARAERGNIHTMSVNTALCMATSLGRSIEELSDPDFIRKLKVAEIDANIAKLEEERGNV